MRWLVVCFLLLVAACAPEFAPPMSGGVMPAVADDAFIARDGTRLALRRWEAQGELRAVIVALHGMSDYSNAFDMPARFWAKEGITTLAFDQRGFGKSENPGIWAGAAAMRADLRDAVAAARTRYPGVPVFALGESMGGAVVLTALASDEPRLDVDGVILVAPAVWSRSDMPLTYRAALFLAAHLLPGLILSNSAASHVVTIIPSDNVPMLIALGRDPLFQRKTRTDTLYGLVNLMDQARSAPDRMTATPPILFLYGAHDQIIPAKPTEAVIAALKSKPGVPLTVRHYERGYHMLLRDLNGGLVDQGVADWIFAQDGAQKRARTVMTPGTELHMANTEHNDLRKGMSRVEPSTNTKLPGHEDSVMPMPGSGEDAVKPVIGSKGGVGEGQGTKSN